MARHTSNTSSRDQGDDNLDLSRIFIGREQQLNLFDIYLARWKQLLLDAGTDMDTPRMTPPSPNNKLQGLVVLLYGRGGFGKSTLLRRYRDIAQEEGRNLIISEPVDWEFDVEGRRSVFNPLSGQRVDPSEYFKILCGQLALAFKKDPKAFREYQAAGKAVDEARKKANGVLDSLQKDDRYAAFRTVTVEVLMGLLRSSVPGSSVVLDTSSAKAAANEGAKITIEQLARVRTRLHDVLGNKFGDYLDPALRLGLALGRDLSSFARNFPLLIFFDTYEEIDEGDRLLRVIMAGAGKRVGWVLAGRDNLWAGADQMERSVEMEYGYKDIVLSDRGLSVNFNAEDIGAFTISDIQEYFDLLRKSVQDMHFLPVVTEEDARRLQKVTQSVPLAVKIAAGLYLETANLELVTEKGEGKRQIVDQMVRRYLLHTRADQGERVKLYGLALLRRADRPQVIAAALGLTSEQAQIGYERELSRLHRRYSFIFTEKEQPTLHQEVRYFLRLWLLEHRQEPEIVAVNQRLLEAHEKALKELEDQMHYTTLQERLHDDEWVETYLDLTEQCFWLDPVEGARHILPFMIAAAIYRRNINKDAAELGKFFETGIRSFYRAWWSRTAQSLMHTTSRNLSQDALEGLKYLVQIADQHSPIFAPPLPHYRGELEAALWWRLGEAYSGQQDDSRALEWYEKALTRLGKLDELKEAMVQAAWNAAYTLYQQKKYSECILFLNRAIELDPNDVPSYNSRGDTYAKLKEYQRAIADYNRTIELDPDDATAYRNRGDVYRALKEYQRAITDYNRAIELDPNHASAYNDRGLTYADLEEQERALQDYNRAIELNLKEDSAYIYINRGNAYDELGDYERALQDYNRTIELDPNHVAAYYNRGIAYSRQQKYSQAIDDYTTALRLDPDDAAAYYNRGYGYLYLKNIIMARIDFVRGAELAPSDANIAWMVVFSSMEKERSGIEVAEQLEHIAVLDPASPSAYICLAVASGLRRKPSAGLGMLEQVLRKHPESENIYFWKGMLSAYYYRSHPEIALEAIEKALECGLPPVLMMPLYWFQRDNPTFFEQYAKPLLERCGL